MPTPSNLYSRRSTYLCDANAHTWLDFVIAVIVLISQSQLASRRKQTENGQREKEGGGWVETLTGRRWVHRSITDKTYFLQLLFFFPFWWITENVPFSNVVDPSSLCNEALYFLTELYCPRCHSCIWHLNPFPLSTTGPSEYECSLRKIKWLTENLLNNFTLTGNWLTDLALLFLHAKGRMSTQPLDEMLAVNKPQLCWNLTFVVCYEANEPLVWLGLGTKTPESIWSVVCEHPKK